MLKQSKTLFILSLFVTTGSVITSPAIVLSPEELSTIAQNPELAYVYVNDTVRLALAFARACAPVKALLDQLHESYKMAPRADVLAAVDAAIVSCKNANTKTTLESYRKDVMEGDATVCGLDEDESDTATRRKNKNRFCSLFVKNCVSAGNLSVNCNSSIGGNERVAGDIVFGPCGLHATGAAETGLLTIRGILSRTTSSGCGFTISSATSILIINSNNFPAGVGVSFAISFCNKFGCIPSIVAQPELPIDLFSTALGQSITITKTTFPCLPSDLKIMLPQVPFYPVVTIENVTTSGFTIDVIIPFDAPATTTIGTCSNMDIANAILSAIRAICPSCFGAVDFIATGPCSAFTSCGTGCSSCKLPA